MNSDLARGRSASPVEMETPSALHRVMGSDGQAAPCDDWEKPGDCSLVNLVELVLKNPARLDDLARVEQRQVDLIPRFLAIGLASFGIFTMSLVLILAYADASALPSFMASRWSANPVASAVSLCLAYTLGLAMAAGVCLPSFYFYSLLAGIRVSVLQVAGQVMKGKAATSMMLMGVLPSYVAVALGAIIFRFPHDWLQLALYFGLVLPFIAGLWGVRAIYIGFVSLADTMAPERRCQRECLLRRLTLACAGCYTAVSPVMIYTLWVYFADLLAGRTV
jgi:hypothetical protein